MVCAETITRESAAEGARERQEWRLGTQGWRSEFKMGRMIQGLEGHGKDLGLYTECVRSPWRVSAEV